MMLQKLLALEASTNPLSGFVKSASEKLSPNFSGDCSAVATGPLETLISVFLGFFTALGGLMFLVYMVFAGLTWITANGEKGKIDTAKQSMINGAIGLVVVIVSQAIIGIVGGVLGIDILNPILILNNIWGGC
ncbi:MAG: hypothetical protein UX04_C0002G0036 [Microgenomates group bacterium GW2011_GWF2_45_18]|nr:MAG: hypothetical protein UW18_C0001G0061 [Microgenomates group bacterium GW2011_GWF1_44_10]KKU01893.1 MAG: hypothetical protein UX04_C0002G0036 [Microgenomates group bacterium GW2011_GWF2_45_18]HAU98790.1 hypothetical protein [Candidatus Paceibacterota bacterium]HAX01390.1 hypothetical protein [Candidatus Paceibacterota bacterium]